jgi:asparagine synthase (glutamine-hydrolysing)
MISGRKFKAARWKQILRMRLLKSLTRFFLPLEYRQVSDVPVGAFLSGGVDSSLICAKFQEQNTNPINTYTIGFDVAKYDESLFCKKCCQYPKTNHTEARISESSSINVVNQLL